MIQRFGDSLRRMVVSEIDGDNEVQIMVFECQECTSFYINKEDAVRLIAHLKEQFKL